MAAGRSLASILGCCNNLSVLSLRPRVIAAIRYVGMGAAALTFIAMMFSWSQLPAVNPDGTPGKDSLFDEMLKAFIIGVTIVVS